MGKAKEEAAKTAKKIEKKKKNKQKKEQAKKAQKEDLPEVIQEGSQSDSDAEDSPDESVRVVKLSGNSFGTHTVKMVKYTDKDVLSAVDKVKVAKGIGSMQVLYGTVGPKPSQSGHQMEVFLPDTGASVNIIPELTCKENGIKIYKPSIERTVIDASGNRLNNVGEGMLYACLNIFSGKMKLETNVKPM